jgi:hypothetical protein
MAVSILKIYKQRHPIASVCVFSFSLWTLHPSAKSTLVSSYAAHLSFYRPYTVTECKMSIGLRNARVACSTKDVLFFVVGASEERQRNGGKQETWRT